jgi:Pyruvate/2-oxoacid:ferredoxin oxidoreductase gamma subunit
VLYNRTLFTEPPAIRTDCRWIPVDAGRLASELAYLQGQSLVALGAFCALTGIVAGESLAEALRQMLPAYRHHTIPKNVECLEAGARAMAAHAGEVPAWRVASDAAAAESGASA